MSEGARAARRSGAEWVLVTDGGTGQNRSSLAAVRALAQAGYCPAVTVSAPRSLAASSRHCRRRVPVPPVDDAAYASAIESEARRHPYLAVMPTSDRALLSLGQPGNEFVDKVTLAERARGVGIPVVDTTVFATADELLAAGPGLHYPLVLKPAVSSAPVRLVASPDELSRPVDGPGPFLVQPYVDEAMRAVAGVSWDGSLVAAVQQRYVRSWPVRCGVACWAQTTEVDADLAERLLALVEDYDGIFQAQFVGPFLVDLNTRPYGSLPLAVAAGANLVGIYCDLVAGRRVPPVRGRPGVYYRWLEGDVRHTAHRLRRGEMTALELLDVRPRRGTAHSTESLDDPAPTLVRLAFALGRRRR